MLHALVAAISQQLLDGVRKLAIDIPCEGWAGIVRQNAYQHDGVVLHMGTTIVFLGQELAYLLRSDGGSLWRRLGRFDDDWQVEDFFFLFEAVTCRYF